MTEWIRSWLIGIVCAAMIVALAESLVPAGTMRKVLKMTGGLVMLLAVLQPVVSLDELILAQSLSDYRTAMSTYDVTLEQENEELIKAIIAEQSGAYILDKAESLGISCTVSVETEHREEGDYPLPYRVTIYGNLTQEQQEQLTREIAADFAIPAERQHYESGELE